MTPKLPGQPKSTGADLPPRMIRVVRKGKHGQTWQSYYYQGYENGKRKQIPLGTDLNQAKRKWAELEQIAPPADANTMAALFDRYEAEVIPTKAPRTQKDNKAELKFLRTVYAHVPIDNVQPKHIAQYRDGRGKTAPSRANREISTLSAIFNWAREQGYCKDNPCFGIKKNKENSRDYYAEDDVYQSVMDHACQELKDAMELAYLTGQRPADILLMKLTDIRNGALEIKQGKTNKKLRILMEPGSNLYNLVDEIKSRPHKIKSMFLIASESGEKLTYSMRRTRFDNARHTAALAALEDGNAELALRIKEFQFRDIRPKAASDIELDHASKLLGHSDSRITQKVYRRKGDSVDPTR
ncbi:tyrosine-type recombinase/integrase [Methylomonas sp. AM2-LC]|uniref:tyrosine-type recombinase/integrase n=1 Tax=Methylomonas sp. AM2-LC TaxID=3153301 RepID=UPI003265E6C5